MSKPLSLDTVKLMWGITPTPVAPSQAQKEIQVAKSKIEIGAKNQLKKRRLSKKKRR